MDGSGLLVVDQLGQARVDGALDRPISLAKNSTASRAREYPWYSGD